MRRPGLPLLGDSLRFGLRAWIGSVADDLNFRVDQVIVALIASEAALGIYAVSVNAFEVLLYLPGAAATALLPLVAGTPHALRAERTLHVFRSAGVITAASLVVAALLGPVVLPLAFGSAFEGSVVPFLLLLPGALGALLLAVFTNALVASSAPGLSSLGPLASLVVGLALDFALIPTWGASGAAAAASAAFFAGGVTALLSYRRRERFPWSELVHPRRGDMHILRALFARVRRPRPGTAAEPDLIAEEPIHSEPRETLAEDRLR
jgi:O-antigen/teichoic acid export membrane protein